MVYNRKRWVARLFAAGHCVRRSQRMGPGHPGAISDIHAPDMHQPARVEYWDDEIDSPASFDLLTQRRTQTEKIYLPRREEGCSATLPRWAEVSRGAIKKARGKTHRHEKKAIQRPTCAQLDSGLMPKARTSNGIRYPQARQILLTIWTAPSLRWTRGGRHPDAQRHRAPPGRGADRPVGRRACSAPRGWDVLYQTMDDLAIAAQKQTPCCENFLRG